MKSLFFLATLALLLQRAVFPNLLVNAYAPFLAYLFLREKQRGVILWIAALIGTGLDLLSSHPFGLFAVSMTCVAWLLFPLRIYFSEESPLHIALYTALIGATSTLLFALFLFDTRFPFTGQWLLTDVLGMSLVDALYGLLWLFLPMQFGKGIQFWLKKKKVFPLSR